MKKILSILTILLSVISVNAVAQSNLTWVMKEKANETYFDRTEFTCNISGISSQKEAADLQQKMKSNTDIVSVKDLGKDAGGNYQFNIVMKAPQNKSYYLNWASKMGVSYIMTLKGEKKTIQEVLAAGEKKSNESHNESHKH